MMFKLVQVGTQSHLFDSIWLHTRITCTCTCNIDGSERSVAPLMTCGRGALTRLSFHLTDAVYTIDSNPLPCPDDDTDFTAFDLAHGMPHAAAACCWLFVDLA
jgi:hypothetical protein